MPHTWLVACLLLLFSADIAGAQYAERSGVDPKLAVSRATLQSAPSDTTPGHGAVAVRGLTGLLGFIPGAFIGGIVAVNALPHRPCGCDDPGLKEFLEGFVVGGTLGAAIGAAAPNLGSNCSFAHRFGRGLIGAALGTGVGMIPITEGSKAISVPILSVTGAALAEWPC